MRKPYYVRNIGKIWHIAHEAAFLARVSKLAVCGFESKSQSVNGWAVVSEIEREPLCHHCLRLSRQVGGPIAARGEGVK